MTCCYNEVLRGNRKKKYILFLLHCEEDDSLLIYDESDVIYEKDVGKGDTVQFVYKEKIYFG